jgi:hypothetical protein
MRNIITKSSDIDVHIFKDSYTRSIHNYFIGDKESCTVSIKLYNAKVSWVDYRTISFGFNKAECNLLLKLLKNIQDSILVKLNSYKEDYGFTINHNVNPMYFEKGDYFYIKCNLPNKNNKYFIDFFDSIEIEAGINNKTFNIPRVGCIYKYVIIDIRNIFEDHNGKSGFHLELKQVYY